MVEGEYRYETIEEDNEEVSGFLNTMNKIA
jgi:hypothetical protein